MTLSRRYFVGLASLATLGATLGVSAATSMTEAVVDAVRAWHDRHEALLTEYLQQQQLALDAFCGHAVLRALNRMEEISDQLLHLGLPPDHPHAHHS